MGQWLKSKEGGQAIQRKQGRATHTGAYNENRGVQPKTREHKQGRTTQTGAYNTNRGVQPKQGNANRGVQRKQGRTAQNKSRTCTLFNHCFNKFHQKLCFKIEKFVISFNK